MENARTWLKPGGRIVAASTVGRGGLPGLRMKFFFRVVLPLIQREDATRWILHKRPWTEMERAFGTVELDMLADDTAWVGVAHKV